MVNSTVFEYIMFVLIMLNTLCLAMQVGMKQGATLPKEIGYGHFILQLVCFSHFI